MYAPLRGSIPAVDAVAPRIPCSKGMGGTAKPPALDVIFRLGELLLGLSRAVFHNCGSGVEVWLGATALGCGLHCWWGFGVSPSPGLDSGGRSRLSSAKPQPASSRTCFEALSGATATATSPSASPAAPTQIVREFTRLEDVSWKSPRTLHLPVCWETWFRASHAAEVHRRICPLTAARSLRTGAWRRCWRLVRVFIPADGTGKHLS